MAVQKSQESGFKGPLLYLICITLIVITLLVPMQMADYDLWGKLSIGAILDKGHYFPYRDVFSYSQPNGTWIDHEWLSGVIFYNVTHFLGDTGLVLLKYFLIAGTFFLIFYLHHKQYKSTPLYGFYGLLLTLLVYIVGYLSILRCQVFTFLAFILFIVILEKTRQQPTQKRLLLWLLPIGVLWANLHGGFMLGLILIALYGVGQSFNKSFKPDFKQGLPYFLTTLLLFILIGFLNPYGWNYISYIFYALALDRHLIMEWQPVPILSFEFFQIKILFLFTLFLLFINFKKSDSSKGINSGLLSPAFVLLFSMILPFKAIRFLPFSALTFVTYLPLFLNQRVINTTIPRRLQMGFASSKSWFLYYIPGTLCLVALVILFQIGETKPIFRTLVPDQTNTGFVRSVRYPLGIIEYLQASPYTGNIMGYFTSGEFLYWTLYPRFKVFIDGRYEEIFSQNQYLYYHDIFHNPNPQKALAAIEEETQKGKADFIVILSDSKNLPLILSKPQWVKLYSDEVYTLVGRVSSLQKFPQYTYHPHPQKTMYLSDFLTPSYLQRF